MPSIIRPLSSSTSLTLVVPCYNPAPRWGQRLVSRFRAFAKTCPTAPDLVLVHDGTPGGLDTSELETVRREVEGLTYIDLPRNRGKGFALRRGVEAATGDYVVYTDIDLPYTLDSMRRLTAKLLADGGVVAGERFEDYYDGVPPFRRALSKAHRWLMRSTFRLPVSDSQAGLKGFDRAGRAVFLETTVDRFLVDLDFIARCRGRVKVQPVRVELRPDVEFTDFGLAILRREAGNFARVFVRSWTGRG